MKQSKGRAVLAGIVALGAAVGAFMGLQAATSNEGTRYMVTLQLSDMQSEMQVLVERDLDIAGVNLKKKQVDIIATEEDRTFLSNRAFRMIRSEVLENLRVDDGYKTHAEIETILTELSEAYPGITEMTSIGKSLEGREIWALKITDNPGRRELDEPTILFNGMHHAREVMTPEVVLDIAEQLLKNYGTQADATRWVNSNEIWLVPMVNPDGNNKVWGSDNMWRKNARDGHGVDINRNYPYAWNKCGGSSGSTWSQTYRGKSGGSEPETQALMGLVERIRPVFDISFHSYSELVIYPYGCPEERTPTREVVESIGKAMAQALESDDGRDHYTPGTPWETLYPVDGDDIGWMYHEYQVIPYVIEVNSSSQGFQPSYSRWREPTVKRMRPGWQMLLERLEGSSIRGRLIGDRDVPVNGAVMKIERVGGNAYKQDYRINPDGTFHVVLSSGRYKVSFEAQGHEALAREVTVGNDRLELDVVRMRPRTER